MSSLRDLAEQREESRELPGEQEGGVMGGEAIGWKRGGQREGKVM